MSNNHNSHNLPGLPPTLHDEDEAVAIENAIRAAIKTVMNVICSACNRRVQEYQRMVADRDKEIRRLECKLEKSENELKMLREVVDRRQPNDRMENEPEVKSCGVGATTPTHLSPKCHDTAEAFPHQHAQTEAPSWEGDGTAGCQPFGCITSLVKEEPSDLETVIKWEVCEGSLPDQQEGQHGGEYQHKEKPAKTDTQESEAKTANPQMNKLMTTEEEDEPTAHLKRKGGERNGCYMPESEEEQVVMKKPCVTQPSTPKITSPKDCHISSQQPQRQSSNGSITSNLNAQDPLACQQQTYITMTAPQPTCDPILLEVLVSLETIKQQNTTILQILQSGNSSGTLHCEPPDVGTLPLPLQSVQDLRSLEQRLCTEPELKKKMISYLGLAGGMTTKESVWRIMAKLFTNTLAKNVNWRGRNNKQKIENLTIKRVILNAVRQNSFCKDAVDEEIERYIKRWLQLAGDRDGGRKRRQEKGKEANSVQDYCVDEMFTNVIE
ncbi:uncharacterized protein LOC108899598 isoform X1 [Lates calcarifer]|uniref:Uncharacterized protein LOC108899598 isoform X1 n=1 Tax=Lates calcarifer TaxID=8187 RepID=A0AAJ7VIL8_LATCA|nr:uncharacterized protein LOC108899598 isoform X1 [Lates calcarifer]